MSDNPQVVDFDDLIEPLFACLKERGSEMTVSELREAVANKLKLSREVLKIPHKLGGGDRRTRYEYNLAWACTYLKNSGHIINVTRGKWQLTSLGVSTEQLNARKVVREVRTYNSGKNGESVTVPETSSELDELEDAVPEPLEESFSLHTEFQWLLLKLGQDMGLDVWIASNDKTRHFGENYFDSQPRLLKKLPQRFDEATQKTVELIDVLWLKGQAIVGAFEIENTSSIYSGLLRLSDLLSMQPDIDVPLFIVAPNERERKVILEINRPTFSKATKLSEKCRYISYSALREAVRKAEGLATHLSPKFIGDFSIKVNSSAT
jgi:hypothetical protein